MADDLHARIAELEAELRQAREQHAADTERHRLEMAAADVREAATAAILRSIAGSTSNAQPVLDAVVQSAQRLSASLTAGLEVRVGDALQFVAKAGEYPGTPELGGVALLSEQRIPVRAFLERQMVSCICDLHRSRRSSS